MKHLFGWLILSLAAQASILPEGISEVAPGVWFRQSKPGSGLCNNIFIEMKDFLVVVDANFPAGAKTAIGDAKALSPKPVKWVVDTHHHGDHLYGNAVWTRAGATTIAHRGVVEEIRRYEPEEWRLTGLKQADVAELHLPSPEPPRRTYTGDMFVIEDSTRRVELHHYGWSHTRGDSFVYLPKEKILCTGDVVVNGPFNFTPDAYLANWPKVIASVQKLAVERVLPGHGPAAGPELLDGQRRFLEALYAEVVRAIQKGSTLDQLVTFADGRAVSTTIRLPEEFRTWVGERRLPGQVRDCYREITAGKPAGALPHAGPAPR